jgi:Hint domain
LHALVRELLVIFNRLSFVFVCLVMICATGCGGVAQTSAVATVSTPTAEAVSTVNAGMSPTLPPSVAAVTPDIEVTSTLDSSPISTPSPAATLGVESVTVTPTPTASAAPDTLPPAPTPLQSSGLSITQLKYKLIERFGQVGTVPGIFYCDPDQFPLARVVEPDQVLTWFEAVDKNGEEYHTVLQHVQLPTGVDLSSAQQLLVYQNYKELMAITLTPAGDGYHFGLRVSQGGAVRNAPGLAIDGNITTQGAITILSQQPTRLSCPICLALGTQIDTPNGPVPVEDLRLGMIVWTITRSGLRIAQPLVEAAHTPVPIGHQVVRLQLDDSRMLRASAGHPTADGRVLGNLVPGDILDGAKVMSVKRELYGAAETYDILPAGDTGFYWADSILMGSTLSIDQASSLP